MLQPDYIAAVLNDDRAGLTRMYKSLFPAIFKLVRDNGGSEEDAKDVFQDAVIVVYEKAQRPDFRLTSRFSTYFYGICRNLWMTKRLKKSASEVTIPDHAQYIPDDSTEIDLLQIRRGKLFYKALRQLGDDCQKLLQLFFEERSMSEIALEMGFSGEGHARVRKSRCKDHLIELIKNDLEYPELKTV